MTDRPFSELRDTGLLWLINRVVFHPRGYSLALHYDMNDNGELGEVTGWSLLGDGSEPWSMGDPPPGSGHATEDELFARVQSLLHREVPS